MFATVTPFTRLSSKSKFLFAHNVDIMITVCTVFSEISFEFNVNVCSAKQNLLFSHSCRGPPVVVTNDGESEVGECVCVCGGGRERLLPVFLFYKENEGVEVEEENMGRQRIKIKNN